MSTTPMMTLQQAAGWLPQSRLQGDGNTPLLRVHTDTRTLQPGDLFVALQGDRFDANDFLAQARDAGAAAALCHAGRLDGLDWNGLEVADTRLALGQLAAAWRSQFRLPLIAVTGSNGKTTVTQMLASILAAAAGEAAFSTRGNLNNDIGVPMTLLRLRDTHRLAVVELGMNHPGEIAGLAAMAAPTVALVNNAQREHQEFMGTVEAVARENGCVISALPTDGIAVYPADEEFTPIWRELAGERPSLCFGEDAAWGAQVFATAVSWQGDHWQVEAATPQGALAFRLQVAGRHNIRNALAAVACAQAAGVALAQIAEGLSAFEPVKGRSRALQLQWQGRPLTVVDDSYNANPDSVRAAIEVLRELPAPRVLVLGDMGEVGDQGEAFHIEIGQFAQQQGIEQLFTLGALARHAAGQHGAARHCGDSAQDMPALLQALPPVLAQAGSVLVKGSRFMQMERVIELLMQEQQQEKDTTCCQH